MRQNFGFETCIPDQEVERTLALAADYIQVRTEVHIQDRVVVFIRDLVADFIQDQEAGGGMYTGPDSDPYMAIHPPWSLFAIELRKMGMRKEAEIIEKALRNIGWKI